ncbi:MAG: hypothetical protein LUI02_03235 [Clostridiales bacterium]|nr:hypothetical protein [Clostridiales bacterium]
MATRNDYYVDGNTVRELASPQRREQERREREEREEMARRRRRRNAVQRNRARAMGMSRGYVAFLTVCVFMVAGSAAMLVHLQAQVTTRINSIASLQSQVNDLRADNDARYKRLTTSVDLSEIRDVAINELGMSYPSEDQVIYYSVENSNFMDQYEDIPN